MLCALVMSAQDNVAVVVSSIALADGESGEVGIYLSCPQDNCAAIDISLEYNPLMLQVNAVNWGTYIVSNADVYPILSRHDTEFGQIQLTVVSTGRNSEPQDNLELLRLEVTLLTDVETQIVVSQITVGADVGNAMLPVSIQSGEISIAQPQMPTINCRLDIDNNHIIDHNDLILAQQSFHIDTAHNAQLDVNQDGLVNILDVIAVSQGFGQITDGCTS